jgi:hypothetical protein
MGGTGRVAEGASAIREKAMRPISYEVLGRPVTISQRLATLDAKLAALEVGKAKMVATSHYGEREWLERRARYVAEREELQQRIAAENGNR